MGYKGMCSECALAVTDSSSSYKGKLCLRYNSTCQQVARNCPGPVKKTGPFAVARKKSNAEGHTGTLEQPMETLAGEMWRVNLDNGMSAGVRDGFLRDV